MAKTVFSSLKVFQQATFLFKVKSDIQEENIKDSRGNLTEDILDEIAVTFAIKPSSKGSDTRQDRTVGTDTYTAYTVSDEGVLNPGIIVGMVGTGEINGEPCEAKITTKSQSLAYPITKKPIGDVVGLEIYFKSLSKS